MRNYATIIIVFISLGVAAQSGDLKSTKFRTGMVFSSDLYSTKGSTTAVTGYEIEQNSFNYSAGVMGYFMPGWNVEFGTGLIYSNKDFTGTWYCHVCDFDSRSESFKLRYIEIPVIARYYLINKNPSLFYEVGLTNCFLWQDIHAEFGPMKVNTYHLDGQMGLGTNINLGPRLQFSGSILYRYGWTTALRPYGFKTTSDIPYESMVVMTGIIYKID